MNTTIAILFVLVFPLSMLATAALVLHFTGKSRQLAEQHFTATLIQAWDQIETLHTRLVSPERAAQADITRKYAEVGAAQTILDPFAPGAFNTPDDIEATFDAPYDNRDTNPDLSAVNPNLIA